MSPVSNQLWETVVSSRLVGVPPGGREISPRLGSRVRRWDLVPFRLVDRSTPAESPSDTEGKELVVSTWNNSACLHHRQSRECGQGMGSQQNSPVAAFRLRHDAGAFSLLGACIQDSSRPVPGRVGRCGESSSFCTSVRRTSIISSQRVRYCGLWGWFRQLSLYGPASLLVVCRPDV